MGKESTASKPQGPSPRYSQGLRRDSKIQKITCYHHQQQISQDCNGLSRQSKVSSCFSCHHKQEQGVSEEYVISDGLVIMEVSEYWIKTVEKKTTLQSSREHKTYKNAKLVQEKLDILIFTLYYFVQVKYSKKSTFLLICMNHSHSEL